MTTKLAWVDELSPPVRISYDDINQRLQYTVDRTVLGTGTGSNFNAFTSMERQMQKARMGSESQQATMPLKF